MLGGWLAAAGDEVVLVARPAHVDAIDRDGLRITGFRGDAVVRAPLSAVTDPALVDGPIDALILLTKTRDTDHALAAAAPLRDRVGVAFSLQNAVDKDQRLAAWLGADRVILKGTALMSFGAFFNRAWREHDYLWGRLNAADRCVDVLISAIGPRLSEPIDADRLRADLFRAILESEAPHLTADPDLVPGLRERVARHGGGS